MDIHWCRSLQTFDSLFALFSSGALRALDQKQPLQIIHHIWDFGSFSMYLYLFFPQTYFPWTLTNKLPTGKLDENRLVVCNSVPNFKNFWPRQTKSKSLRGAVLLGADHPTVVVVHVEDAILRTLEVFATVVGTCGENRMRSSLVSGFSVSSTGEKSRWRCFNYLENIKTSSFLVVKDTHQWMDGVRSSYHVREWRYLKNLRAYLSSFLEPSPRPKCFALVGGSNPLLKCKSTDIVVSKKLGKWKIHKHERKNWKNWKNQALSFQTKTAKPWKRSRSHRARTSRLLRPQELPVSNLKTSTARCRKDSKWRASKKEKNFKGRRKKTEDGPWVVSFFIYFHG